ARSAALALRAQCVRAVLHQRDREPVAVRAVAAAAGSRRERAGRGLFRAVPVCLAHHAVKGTRVMTRDARAFWTVGSEQGEIRGERLAEPGPGRALVDTLHSGISRGSELLVYRGRVPASEFERMRAPHQEGAFPFPVKYGYCNVGRVRAGSAALLGRDV